MNTERIAIDLPMQDYLLLKNEAENQQISIRQFAKMAVLKYMQEHAKTVLYPLDMDLCRLDRMEEINE